LMLTGPPCCVPPWPGAMLCGAWDAFAASAPNGGGRNVCSRLPENAARDVEPARILQGRGRRGICRSRDRARRGRQEEVQEGGARRRGQGAGRPELLQRRGRFDPHHVAGVSDLLRRAGYRDRKEVRLQEGWLQPE